PVAVVKEGGVVIVDEFTGRLMEGRQWSDGLHQAVEAKEGVKIKEETQTLATITLQNFFKLYNKLSGMTGTAMTEAGEFWKIYELDVIAIPTNRVLQRKEFADLIYCSENEKYVAIAEDIERKNKWDVLVNKDGSEEWGTILGEDGSEITFQPKGTKEKLKIKESDYESVNRQGRPVLVGTTSIEKSEQLSTLLDRRGIKHDVLNAKHHRRESEIVAQAGRKYAVTIATNMAGRGTDIVLGGNPETMAWAILQDKYPTRLDVPREEWDELVDQLDKEHGMSEQGEHLKGLGGLHVVGTERHEARRIDLQLRGRCGRQGDPGSSRFYLSLEDDLMRIFAGPWVEKVFRTLGMTEGEAIESKAVTRRIEGAQKKVEERNFEIRKNLLEYDEVMDEQRKRVYTYRQNILEGANCKELVLEMIEQQVDLNISSFMDPDYGRDTFVSWVGSRLTNQFDSRDFRGMDFDEASKYALEQAERMAETQIHDAIEENLPLEEEERDWSWSALAKFANTRWGLSLRDRDLKKIGRDEVAEHLMEKAHEAIKKIDLADGAIFLDKDFNIQTVAGWVKHKFGADIKLDDLRDKDAASIQAMIGELAEELYDAKEAEYPVMAALYRFTSKGQGGNRLDRSALVTWAQERFNAAISEDDLKSKQREEIREELMACSRSSQQAAETQLAEVRDKVATIFGDSPDGVAAANTGANGQLEDVRSWASEKLDCDISEPDLNKMTRSELQRALEQATEDQFRPEMRNMERALMLQLVDSAWKEHLLVMDHLRSAVGLVGYAQVDPKVEYKREGMRLFEKMWDNTGERITDLIFRMEQLDERFVGSTWVEGKASKEAARPASDIAEQQDEAIRNSQDQKAETIRNVGSKVGRNDPCPCGSGKKYKKCC
ncbi:MAG: SEC-C metal-binding domain-containing protein, partial [Planctomycetota bacterium]